MPIDAALDSLVATGLSPMQDELAELTSQAEALDEDTSNAAADDKTMETDVITGPWRLAA